MNWNYDYSIFDQHILCGANVSCSAASCNQQHSHLCLPLFVAATKKKTTNCIGMRQCTVSRRGSMHLRTFRRQNDNNKSSTFGPATDIQDYIKNCVMNRAWQCNETKIFTTNKTVIKITFVDLRVVRLFARAQPA